MSAKENATIEEKPSPLGGGPLGLGDPDDLKLRKTERDIILPKLIREEARKKCPVTLQAFLDCSKEAGLLVPFKCQEAKNANNDCILSWAKKPEFVKEVTNMYLERRSYFRKTGEPVERYQRVKSSSSNIRVNMSAVPQGAFAALKIKKMLQSNQTDCQEEGKEETKFEKHFLSNGSALDQSPLKYSSKLMNSIWGLYNQYSVHNLKKNKDSGEFAVFNNQCM